jgi:hypothetical protein
MSGLSARKRGIITNFPKIHVDELHKRVGDRPLVPNMCLLFFKSSQISPTKIEGSFDERKTQTWERVPFNDFPALLEIRIKRWQTSKSLQEYLRYLEIEQEAMYLA